MGLRLGMVFLVVAALAAMARAAAHPMHHVVHFGLGLANDGQGLVGDSMDQLDQEVMMESDSSRRLLKQGGYISYGALSRNRVPCSQRGQSYYNCRAHQKANPYNRGCTRITNCARTNH